MKSFRFTPFGLFLVLGIYSTPATSQTLTCQSNCPQAGDLFSMRTSSPVISQAGANQVWNFSGIQAVSPVTHNISYDAASALPSASLYPQANLIKTFPGGSQFLSTNSGGIRSSYANTVSANGDLPELPLPIAYGDTYTQVISATSVVGTDTYVVTTDLSFYAHASGTLILPTSVSTNVLAIKFKSTKSTTKNGLADGPILYTNAYYFYSSNIHHPLLYSRYLSESGPNDYGPYTEFIDHMLVGISEQSQIESGEWKVFPNPAHEVLNITISSNERGRLSLTNNLGQEVLGQEYANGDIKLDVENVPAGVYFLTKQSNSSKVTEKIVIMRH